MTEISDADLLQQFARDGSEAAFATLVERHISLVHSVALRHTADPQQAEDITQSVFIILARKAGILDRKTILAGWLYHAARLTAQNLQRSEIRRRHREQEAYMQSTLHESAPDPLWPELSPLLEDAMSRLRAADRDALVLRYFQNKSLVDVGIAMGLNERAAQKRVLRAVEKLRAFFGKHGVTSTTDQIVGSISTHSVQAVSPTLVKTVAAIAIVKGATTSTSVLTLTKGTLKMMAWTKIKTAAAAGAIVLLAAGTTTMVTVAATRKPIKYDWQVPQANFSVFYKAQPQMTIVPTSFPDDTNGGFCCDGTRGAMGINQPLNRIVELAYQKDDLHTVVASDLPAERYDFLAKLVPPQLPRKRTPIDTNWSPQLQKKIADTFGITGHLEMRSTDVFVICPVSEGTHGFKVSHNMPGGLAVKTILEPAENGARVGYECHEQPFSTLLFSLQNRLKVPVVDQTGLTNSYDFSFSWIQPRESQALEMPAVDVLNPLLSTELGLQLVRTNMPIEMLVVEKTK